MLQLSYIWYYRQKDVLKFHRDYINEINSSVVMLHDEVF